MNKLVKCFFVVFIIIVFMFCFWGVTSTITSKISFGEYCAKEYKGIVQSNYCVYQINGSSYSFPYDIDWIGNYTSWNGMLLKKLGLEDGE